MRLCGFVVLVVVLHAAPVAAARRPAKLKAYPVVLEEGYQGTGAKVIGVHQIGGRTVMVWTESGKHSMRATTEEAFASGVRSVDETTTVLGIADTTSHELIIALEIARTWKIEGYEDDGSSGAFAYKTTFANLDGDGGEEIVLKRTKGKELPAELVLQMRHGKLREVNRTLAACRESVDVATLFDALERAPDAAARACLLGDLLAAELPEALSVEDLWPWAVTDVALAPRETRCAAAGWMTRHGKTAATSRYVVFRTTTGNLERVTVDAGNVLSRDVMIGEVRAMAAAVVEDRLIVVAELANQTLVADGVTDALLLDHPPRVAIEQRDGTIVVDGQIYDPKVGGFHE